MLSLGLARRGALPGSPSKVVRMLFLIVGVLLLAMKLAEFGPVAALGWAWVLLPFGLTAVWWTIADKTGLTRRRAERRMDERKAERRQRSLERLGLGTRPSSRIGKPAAPSAGRPDNKPAARPPEPERRDPRA
jgi:small Trp-rich protein